jgi:hypothetical protein
VEHRHRAVSRRIVSTTKLKFIGTSMRPAIPRAHTGPDELGKGWRPVNNLRIAIRMRSTARRRYSVRKSSISWRKLDGTAVAAPSQGPNLESRIECRTASWPWLFFFDYKTGGNAVVLSRRQHGCFGWRRS